VGPPIRVHADTSVYGGLCDPEFARHSAAFFEAVSAGRLHLVASAVVDGEIRGAPEHVRELALEMLSAAEFVPVTAEALELQQAYLDAGIVGRRGELDALHVAVATVAACRVIVSWNFRHIVHLSKIALYNAVNVVEGFSSIAVHSPPEVVAYGDEGA
jgi:hypothetical protein